MAPEPSTAIRSIMRRSVTPAPPGPAAWLGGAAANETPADHGARGRLPGGGPRLEQPLGEVVLLRPAALLAAAHAVVLDLALEHGERLLEGQAETLGRDVGVKLGPARQVHGDRAARDRPALGARLVGELHARRRRGHVQAPERRLHLAVHERPQRPIFAESFDHHAHRAVSIQQGLCRRLLWYWGCCSV